MQMIYPEHLAPDEVVARVLGVLTSAPANRAVFLDPRLSLPNFISRVCWKAGVSPLAVLVAFQRERSLFTLEAGPDSHSWQYACGVVGQDGPGTTNHRWDGLLNQILICAELHAWCMGAGSDSNFGYRPGLWPSAAKRWPRANTVTILDENGKSVKEHTCETAAEYAQLIFTPHLGLGGPCDTHTLDVNAKIAAAYCGAFL